MRTGSKSRARRKGKLPALFVMWVCAASLLGTLLTMPLPARAEKLEEAIDLALKGDPTLTSAEASLRAAEAAYAPDIRVSASVTSRLSMPLYDSGRIDATVAAAQAQKYGARADLQATERDLAQQLESIWLSIDAPSEPMSSQAPPMMPNSAHGNERLEKNQRGKTWPSKETPGC